ncbi:MAG TPA: hypothetical protein VFW38_12610 [Solirubrobacteraceae bacterium]|nr:hypothetical protein [Solirubrobacteraceae bacterium]
MNETLQSLRSDLLSRRMLPFVVMALLALAVALGYALAGSGSTPTPSVQAGTGGSAAPAALAVAAASPNPNAAESETPGGVRYQSGGPTHSPFRQLSEPKGSSSTAPHGKTSTGGSSSGGSSSTAGANGKSGAGGGAEAPTPPKPSKPVKKSKFPYDVSILFGQLPAVAGGVVTLPPYQNVKPQQPLPSASDARIALERVNSTAKSAVFALLAPAILRGQGVCLPSPSECQHVGLEAGQSEELEYLEESGQVAIYELKTVSIVKSSSQAAG